MVFWFEITQTLFKHIHSVNFPEMNFARKYKSLQESSGAKQLSNTETTVPWFLLSISTYMTGGRGDSCLQKDEKIFFVESFCDGQRIPANKYVISAVLA